MCRVAYKWQPIQNKKWSVKHNTWNILLKVGDKAAKLSLRSILVTEIKIVVDSFRLAWQQQSQKQQHHQE